MDLRFWQIVCGYQSKMIASLAARVDTIFMHYQPLPPFVVNVSTNGNCCILIPKIDLSGNLLTSASQQTKQILKYSDSPIFYFIYFKLGYQKHWTRIFSFANYEDG